MSLEEQGRLGLVVGCVSVSVVLVFLLNNVLPSVVSPNQAWRFEWPFKLVNRAGGDFDQGLYRPAALLLHKQNPYDVPILRYPPLVTVLFAPFAVLSFHQAYVLFLISLFALNLGAIACASRLAVDVFEQRHVAQAGAWLLPHTLFIQMSLLTLTSYGFLFSLERGNYDIYAQMCSLLGVIALVKYPQRLWWHVLLLSLGAHLKIYPAILFPLLFWRHGRRALAPLALINVAMLLILGPWSAWRFIERLFSLDDTLWIGNHSAAGFAFSVLGPVLDRGWIPVWPLQAFPICIWAFTIMTLWRRGPTDLNIVLFFVASTPLMHLLPSTSHDYKLVILSAPVAILLTGLMLDFSRRGTAPSLVLGGMVLVAMGYISRSARIESDSYLLRNKYLSILLIQMVTAAVVWRPLPAFASGGPRDDGDNALGAGSSATAHVARDT